MQKSITVPNTSAPSSFDATLITFLPVLLFSRIYPSMYVPFILLLLLPKVTGVKRTTPGKKMGWEEDSMFNLC